MKAPLGLEQMSVMWHSLFRTSQASSLLRQITETFLVRVLLLAIGLGTSVAIARLVGPQGRGVFAVTATISTIGIQFSNLGLHAANIYYVAKERSLLPALLAHSLIVGLGFASLIAGLAWGFFRINPTWAPVQGELLLLALASIPLGLVYVLLQNLLLGLQEVRTYNLIELSSKLLILVLLGILTVSKAVSVETVFAAGLVAGLVAMLWALWHLRQFLPHPPKPSLALFKKNLAFGFKAYMAALCTFLMLKADLLMVHRFLGEEQAGYYSIATTLADLVYLLPVVAGSLLFPRLSGMQDEEEKWRITKNIAGLITLGTACVSLFVALFAKPLLRLLFGASFLPAEPAFLWLLPGIILLSTNTIFMNYFGSRGMPLITVISPTLALGLNIALNIWLIPSGGISGASFASSISYGLMLLISLIYIKKNDLFFLRGNP